MFVGYDGSAPPVRLALKTIEGRRIALDPYPFVNPLRVQLIRREIQRSKFPDPATFRETYFKKRRAGFMAHVEAAPYTPDLGPNLDANGCRQVQIMVLVGAPCVSSFS